MLPASFLTGMTTERSMRRTVFCPAPVRPIHPLRAAALPRLARFDSADKPPPAWRAGPEPIGGARLNMSEMTQQEIIELAAILVNEHGHAARDVAERRRNQHVRNSY